MSKHADNCTWLGLEHDEVGRTVMTRIRSEAPPDIDIGEYPVLVNLYWRVAEDSPHGMPSDAEMKRMHLMDELLHAMEGPDVGFMMFSVTGNMRKEWIWYVKSARGFLRRLNECLQGHDRFPIEIETGDGSGWDSYFSIMKSISKE